METILKIVIMGEERVGKTNIASRMMDNQFEHSYHSTHGVSFNMKKMVLRGSSNEFTIHIWDSSGQPLFKPMTKTIYRDAPIVLVVFNITDRKTYEEGINYWIKSIKETCVKTNPLICLVQIIVN